MVNESSQPKPGDAVLGGQNPEPLINAAVLGGIEGAKQRCADPDVKIRIGGLREAVKYGEAGIELLVHGLKDESPEVGFAAYCLLQKNVEPELKMALKIYDTYQPRFVNLSGHSHPIQWISLSSNGLVLASYTQVIANGFSPNGNIVGSSSIGNIVRVWTLEMSNLNRFDPVALFHSYLEIKQSNSTLYSAIQAIASGTQAEKEAAFSQLKSREELAIQATLYYYINAQPLSQFEVNQSHRHPEWNISTYNGLKYFLETDRSQKAWEETEKILLQEVGGTDINAIKDISKIPCLSTIYELWKTCAQINIPVHFLSNLKMRIEHLNNTKAENARINAENARINAESRANNSEVYITRSHAMMDDL